MSALSEPYWQGAREGRLVIQRCGACGRLRHYPQVICPACQSFSVEHVAAAGTGRVHSWTVTHHAFEQAFASEAPYVLLTVEMDEGVRVLGRYRGAPEELALGLPVRITFASGHDGAPQPTFTPSEAAA
jgi:uncharacterized OB-fold protein